MRLPLGVLSGTESSSAPDAPVAEAVRDSSELGEGKHRGEVSASPTSGCEGLPAGIAPLPAEAAAAPAPAVLEGKWMGGAGPASDSTGAFQWNVSTAGRSFLLVILSRSI